MRKYVLSMLLLCSSVSASSVNVYVCTDERGNKEYKNEPQEGCKAVDLSPITVLKKPKKNVARLDTSKSASIGMTKSQVQEMWGPPDQKSRVQNRKGITEGWSYRDHGKVIFKDGVLEEIVD